MSLPTDEAPGAEAAPAEPATLRPDVEETVAAPRRRKRRWGGRLWREWVRPFLIILVVMGSLRSAVADWNHVPTGSMQPTILAGDRIFVNKLAYDLRIPFTRHRIVHWASPQRGDVIVFLSPADGKRLVKRVIGIPGDSIELDHNTLIVNGMPAQYSALEDDAVLELKALYPNIHEFQVEALNGVRHPIMTFARAANAYPSPKATYSVPVVPDGHYFVMGDNRDESKDSRWFDTVAKDLILGRATAVAISVDPGRHYWPRWGRFFRSLP